MPKAPSAQSYSASDIDVLEGLEPVRKRPGMYIGGTDIKALHHLAAEILDNAMDEAVAGHATHIQFHLAADNTVSVQDDGRGIPVDTHPKFPEKSALEVIFTTLHSGGKFSGKNYQTSGGLHGVGSSVVNALSSFMEVEVWRDGGHFKQSYAQGVPKTRLLRVGAQGKQQGTRLSFRPDPEIFTEHHLFDAKRLYDLCKAKAYLFKGMEIHWSCAAEIAGKIPLDERFHFARGLEDFLLTELDEAPLISGRLFSGAHDFPGQQGKVEWAIAWPEEGEASPRLTSYCNTIPTPDGGTHEAGFRSALYKALREYGERVSRKEAAQITGEDALAGTIGVVSTFIREPQFQGQTKDKLTSSEATKLVDAAVKDAFDLWLFADPKTANALLDRVIERCQERLRRRDDKTDRKTSNRSLRLPGKLTDCSSRSRDNTELFLVEGDSAGGSAKQARNRETQAILPLRGKVLNVASSSRDKQMNNQELNDLVTALGCGRGARYREEDLRYGRVILMTDADVDGAHIATLLITFFWQEIPELIMKGRLYLSCPPLYRLRSKTRVVYAMDDAERERERRRFKAGEKVDISRFKGLGEMPPGDLKETTMDPAKRTLLRVEVSEATRATTADMVERLMGKRPELRFQFIIENAGQLDEAAIDA